MFVGLEARFLPLQEIFILGFPCTGGVGTTRHLHPTDMLGVGVCGRPRSISSLESGQLPGCLHHRITGTAGIPAAGRETLASIHLLPLEMESLSKQTTASVAFADAIVMGKAVEGFCLPLTHSAPPPCKPSPPSSPAPRNTWLLLPRLRPNPPHGKKATTAAGREAQIRGRLFRSTPYEQAPKNPPMSNGFMPGQLLVALVGLRCDDPTTAGSKQRSRAIPTGGGQGD
ncbi:uncharacterized protein LY79DRAFT_240652 [Colletotrichum navitas]|uniref:Uncharacterized protein n=1 Tax=Colletotrichum navitas TaxID=681940 RepID=A0AAD8PXZ3_9PEZI|nr:uncharacterized protein LY79DRAFT_240652 [Colletotrichum navitas]KAK1586139.1 hypothetical protein LY79DRAFT_240652 [Colletotrichum navitas]